MVWHWGVRADSKTAFFLNLLPNELYYQVGCCDVLLLTGLSVSKHKILSWRWCDGYGETVSLPATV